ncbi:bifunctional DNA-formamidopyrimidine glycosylase/DNA-(apurinic or apyrimidinic site) lyase [Prosthecomicrobium hirschii]|uniref:bifunctional DNA-formamidopyrimidine glycosylase/DNA-(apurinic or apyrimidinic site) lyase n=1 Tax=Prosthecodimorpha hirschii TaxID=665126 RepID=UPI00222049F4|nr:bifunctional DNA-formamidopyrimidine glycosylase/DNA-(apurinic or apyrimidinic site) lyase [Prosthecomicrobium hirschii]MCW1841462.1 bifunctional DNA-formamidopyrimidine glycosylase/DNA-(apurinic or apyrimidinic site) lyase [Prosthecomicrobium hirschii]
MPELPEVETVRRGLAPVMEGAEVTGLDCRRPDLRFPLPERFAERVTGRRIVSLARRAKYLLADLDDGAVLIMHLGMSGSFRIALPAAPGADTTGADTTGADTTGADGETPGAFQYERSKNAAHDHVVFTLSNGATVTYNDPRRFGFMVMAERAGLADHPMMRGIGLEPLGNALTGAAIAALFQDRRTSLKAALMDQRLIAGLGNIYVCEALWRARLSPMRAAGTIVTKTGRPRAEAERLADAIRDVLGEAIEAGGSSLRDYVNADGELGYFQHRFAVYDREGEPCPRLECSGVIERAVQSNRSTFFCPVCQR